MDDLTIIRGLSAKTCVCGNTKRPKMSHCKSCYYSLPYEKRKGLYRPWNAGYQDAYKESLDLLEITPERRAEYAEEMGAEQA